jgi:hypothetical protein
MAKFYKSAWQGKTSVIFLACGSTPISSRKKACMKVRKSGHITQTWHLSSRMLTRTTWLLPSFSFACKHKHQQGSSCTQVVYPAGNQQLVLTLVRDVISTVDVIGFYPEEWVCMPNEKDAVVAYYPYPEKTPWSIRGHGSNRTVSSYKLYAWLPRPQLSFLAVLLLWVCETYLWQVCGACSNEHIWKLFWAKKDRSPHIGLLVMRHQLIASLGKNGVGCLWKQHPAALWRRGPNTWLSRGRSRCVGDGAVHFSTWSAVCLRTTR